MRVKLIILSFFLSLSLQAEKHYVATGGGGLGTLASPFANLTQVNAHTFVAGDSLLFNKGDSYYGTLTMDASGSAGSPIYIGSYGTGAMPIITGFSTLSSWTNNGDGKYWATVSGAEAQTNMVTVDGVNTAMGRYPDVGTNLTFEHHDTTETGVQVCIVDNSTLEATRDWTGADIVINKCWWILERSHITDHRVDTLFYSVYSGSSYGLVIDGNYFFIQNDFRCVTGGNEWYHDYTASKFYIWGNPSTEVVKIATVNYLINLGSAYDYITIDGLKLSGSISNAINIGDYFNSSGSGNNIIIKNCDIEFAGFIGISCVALEDNCTIDNNNITKCNADAILIYGGNMTVTNNDISYCGIVPGAFHRGTDACGIRMYGSSADVHSIQYNNIDYVGYNGVGIYADLNATIRYNFINYSMQVTDDGAGIYFGGNTTLVKNVESNIILNTGIGNVNADISRGIYADQNCFNVTALNNVVYNSQESGIIIHSSQGVRVENNLVYGNLHGITFQKATTLNINDTVRYNKVIAREATQYAFANIGFSTSEINNFGLLDYNYFARPIDDDYVIYNNDPDPSVKTHTLSEWRTLSGHETHTADSPVDIDNVDKLHFIYNATSENSYYDLSNALVDVTGESYSGTITLTPYTGLVLIGQGTVTEHIFTGSGTTFLKDSNGNFKKDSNGNFMKIIQ